MTSCFKPQLDRATHTNRQNTGVTFTIQILATLTCSCESLSLGQLVEFEATSSEFLLRHCHFPVSLTIVCRVAPPRITFGDHFLLQEPISVSVANDLHLWVTQMQHHPAKPNFRELVGHGF